MRASTKTKLSSLNFLKTFLLGLISLTTYGSLELLSSFAWLVSFSVIKWEKENLLWAQKRKIKLFLDDY